MKVESLVGLNIEEPASGLTVAVPPKLKPLVLLSVFAVAGAGPPKLNPPDDAGSADLPN